MDDDSPLKSASVELAKVDRFSIEARITDAARLGIVALFAYWSLTLVAPFAIIIIWAVILAVALYPAFQALNMALGKRPRLAAIVLTIASLAIIAGPLAAVVFSFAEGAQALFSRLSEGSVLVPTPAESVRDWPLVGERVYAAWSLAASNLEDALKRLEPSILQVTSRALTKIASIGVDLLSFVVSVIVAGFLFGPGARLAEIMQGLAHRIASDRGVGFVRLATATIRNVARGVIGVAVLQALLCALVLRVFDAPFPGVIAFLVLILCIIQIGPMLVVLPLVIWAWTEMEAGAATLFTLLLAPLVVIDNVMKPVLVARGLSTPTLVILIGVLGGTLSYGLIGLFLGPIVLSVFYELLMVWMRSDAAALPETRPQLDPARTQEPM
ncbi:AI-2E family transporter [Sinorhizobium alkalisoli]|uniref:AI-2E family transporter n=1 Tax=Sinorhizobium alkalisoli TaxID=1752398 RepID=A0A1E3VIC0_9HYPH|nr:AI-2E family transporter [Sinorhizobium alkalisoli]ODR93325.1 AI-2E family transporter [Sinorhizobium alkalisoli]